MMPHHHEVLEREWNHPSTPTEAAARTREARQTVDALLVRFAPLLGADNRIALDDAVNMLATALRWEALARLLGVADALLEGELAGTVIVMPDPPEGEP
jgi:hypothetical protein